MGTPATKAKAKYNKENYEQILLMIPKGTKTIWKDEALQRKTSLNNLIQTAVNLYIKNYPAEEMPSVTNKIEQKEFLWNY